MKLGFMDFIKDDMTHLKVLSKYKDSPISISLESLRKIVFLSDNEVMLVYYENNRYNFVAVEETREEIMELFGE